MTIDEFQSLHVYEQEEVIYERGVFLQTYESGDNINDFYQVASFYVGLYSLLGTGGEPTIRAFSDPAHLPFLNNIDVTLISQQM
jgi:hypothetical protein